MIQKVSERRQHVLLICSYERRFQENIAVGAEFGIHVVCNPLFRRYIWSRVCEVIKVHTPYKRYSLISLFGLTRNYVPFSPHLVEQGACPTSCLEINTIVNPVTRSCGKSTVRTF